MISLRFLLISCMILRLSLGDDQTIGVTQTCVDRTKPNLSKADCDVGDDALLTCTVNESIDRTYKLSWWWNNGLDDSEPLNLVVGSQVSIPDNRFNVTENHRTNSLQIQGITHEDAGEYECRITMSAKEKVEKAVQLLIRRPPKIVEKIVVEPTPAELGGSAQLKCVAEGYPKPSISWRRDHDVQLPTGEQEFKGSVLLINGIHRQDRGIYYCIADNGIGQPDRRSINFDVEFPPKITAPRPRVAQAIGYDIELQCKVEGYPAPSVIWFRNGVQIFGEDSYSISTTAAINDITTSILTVSPVESEHYGDYVCKATNKLATVETTINLFDFNIPNINFAGLQWHSGAVRFHHFASTLTHLIVALLLLRLL